VGLQPSTSNVTQEFTVNRLRDGGREKAVLLVTGNTEFDVQVTVPRD